MTYPDLTGDAVPERGVERRDPVDDDRDASPPEGLKDTLPDGVVGNAFPAEARVSALRARDLR